MNVILSAHFDLAHPVMSMTLDQGKLIGLVDNFAGIFVAYQVNRQSGVPVYLTNFEEKDTYDGAVDVAQKLGKDTLVIVVDTVKESDLPPGKNASIANVYNLSAEGLKKKFGEKVHFIDGFFEQTEDETWIYGNRFGFKTFYFGVPIPKDYHVTDNEILLQTIDNVSALLSEVIEELKR